ncbi:MAG: methylmalonyl-CoA epimerase [Candidatus Aminicenantes bacterium]|nr:methylmalonyl-CoA epimerase [Candidatus Aminicenantes bacterium]
MIKKIDHIAIVVENIDEEIKKYQEILGLSFSGTEVVADQKVKTALFDIGDLHIELLEPLGDDSPVSNFLTKRGGGIHHIAYEVDDIQEQLKILRADQVSILSEKPTRGRNDSLVVFLHPKAFSNVLIELVEKLK